MNIFKFKYSILAFVLVFFVFVGSTNAHEGGASFEKKVGNYKIDVGYDPEEFVSGESQRFDFDLYDSKTEKDVDFTDVWVNISEEKKTVFAGGIYKSELGGAGMTFVFPKEGDYVMSVRFEKDGNNIVESTFPVKVLNGEIEEASSGLIKYKDWFVGIALGLIVGYLVSMFISKKFKVQ